MSDSPHATLPPTTFAEHEIMRQSLLSDLDARIVSAGGPADYVYTTPRPELDRMRRRVAIVLEDAPALVGDADAAHAATEQLLAVSSLLETEAACRDLVAQDAVNEHGELAYEIPDALHAVTQGNLAVRLAYHDAKLADPGSRQRTSFDHQQASVPYRQHLVAQQFDAYERRLEIVPCKQTQSLLGEKVHQDLTHWVLALQGDELPGVGCENGRAEWQIPDIAERLAGESEYVKTAVIEHRHLRHDVAAATGQGAYPDPDYLPGLHKPEWDAAAQVVDGAVDYSLGRPRALDTPTPTRHVDLARDGEIRPGTPARDAYLNARSQAGAVGIALADPRMQRALILVRLEHDQARIASSLPEGYDSNRKPPAWRMRERSEWERHQSTVRALDANAEWQEHLRTELGPNSEQITRRAVALAEAREQILARTPELQRDAIDEELAREPEWLTETLGPRPEVGAGQWQTLAGQLAANRMRFLVADDADPGIRPEQAHLAQQVAQFQAEAQLARSVAPTPSVGLGM